MRMPAIAAMLGALALAACTTTTANRDSAEYQAGYADGCATGGARASRIAQEPQRDENLYANNADYRAGWASGYNVCGAGAGSGRL
jgi:hypothetical protein